jgi:hypothetical protein
MNQLPVNPNPEKVKKTVQQLRQNNRQFDLVVLTLDELIARVDQDLRIQVKNRIQLSSEKTN